MKFVTAQTNRLGNREMNEDRLGVSENEQAVLLVVADGMGGHEGGELAAEVTVDTLINYFDKVAKPLKRPGAFLDQAIRSAHHLVLKKGLAQDPPIDPRTTCVACIVQGKQVWWAHVGDSRLYLLRDGKTVARTQDHSYVEKLYREGEISEQQKESHPQRNYLTRCVGGFEKPPEVELGHFASLQPGDVLVLCSDGFWGPLRDADIERISVLEDLEQALDEVGSLAEQTSYPQSDNISAASLRWLGAHAGQTDESARPKAAAGGNVNRAIEEISRALDEYQGEMEK